MKPLAWFLLAAVAAPVPQIRYFRYEVPLEAPPGANGQSCVLIEPAVFAHAAPVLADLRLYGDGVETPYVIRNNAQAESPAVTVAPINLGTRAGKTVFDAAMPEGAYSDVELAIAGHDFIATVTVWGGQRQQRVSTRIGSYTVFDLTAQRLGRSTVLHLPESNFAFLHFEVDGPLAPLQFQNISVGRPQPAAPRYLGVAESGRISESGRKSVVEFTVPANVPVDRIVFAPPADPVNFSRDVEVTVARATPNSEGSSEREARISWPGSILRIHRVESGHRLDEEKLAIDSNAAADNRGTHWTITVENGDDPPLTFRSVRLEMVERQLCFEATPSVHYAIYFGDAALSAPRYDYGRWFAPRADAAVAILGPEQANPAFQPRPDDRPFTEKHPLLLWLALIVVVALLAWVTLHTAKGMRPPEQMP